VTLVITQGPSTLPNKRAPDTFQRRCVRSGRLLQVVGDDVHGVCDAHRHEQRADDRRDDVDLVPHQRHEPVGPDHGDENHRQGKERRRQAPEHQVHDRDDQDDHDGEEKRLIPLRVAEHGVVEDGRSGDREGLTRFGAHLGQQGPNLFQQLDLVVELADDVVDLGCDGRVPAVERDERSGDDRIRERPSADLR
jgi:hypothetical protein